MPFDVITHDLEASANAGASALSAPLLHIRLRPHQSLSPNGFVTFIGLTFLMMLVPLSALMGTVLWWGVAPFVLGALTLMWFMLKRFWRDGTLTEDLRLWPERIEIERINPRGAPQQWSANPYWVTLALHPKPISNYLTLKGNNREVELGSFLSPDERKTLYAFLTTELQKCRLRP